MTLEQVIEVMKDTEARGGMTVRLHTGDPSLYGAIREQMDELDKLGIGYDVTPGVSSFSGAAAALCAEYTPVSYTHLQPASCASRPGSGRASCPAP